jgi:hypothetical protein
MSRKAQGLSMNVIIIAAIALLVLVILAVIFIGRMGETTKGIDQCKGVCADDESECEAKYGAYYKITNDPCFMLGQKKPDTSKICCVGV